MPYLFIVGILAIFIIAFAMQYLMATVSLRRSWFLSLFYLAASAVAAVVVSAKFMDDRTRLDRTLAGLVMPPGNPARINEMTTLLEVAVENHALVYKYEVEEGSPAPSRMEAIKLNCEQGVFRAVLELGGEIRHKYSYSDSKLVEIAIDRQLCD